MSSSKMVTQLINKSVNNESVGNDTEKSQTTNSTQSNLVFNRDINSMIEKYKNLTGQDRENWINIQKNYMSMYHPFYSLYNQKPENPPPDSEEFMEQAWDNYQYRYE